MYPILFRINSCVSRRTFILSFVMEAENLLRARYYEVVVVAAAIAGAGGFFI